MIILPAPGNKTCSAEITLQLVTELEAAYGSLYQVAESLLDKSLPLCEMVDLLAIVYRHAGCGTDAEALGEFILRQPCTEILISLLLEILEPVERRLEKISPPSAEFLSEMLEKFPDDNEKAAL